MELESRFEPFITGAAELHVINAVNILKSEQTDETVALNALQFLLHKATFNEERSARINLSLIYAEGVGSFIKRDQREASIWSRSIYDKQLSKALVSCHHLLDDSTTLYTNLLLQQQQQQKENKESDNNFFSTLQLILFISNNTSNNNNNDNNNVTDKNIDTTPLFYLAGLLWMKGIGVEQDIHKSVNCFIEATKNGNHKESAYELGRIYSDRYPHSLNQPQQSLIWFKKALEWGDQRALVDLAYGYFEGDDVQEDYDDNNNNKCEDILEKDQHQHQYQQNQNNNKKNRVKKDELAFRYAQQGALAKDKYCQYILGYLYLKGRGTVENACEATEWLEQSAHQGFAEAIEELATIYLRGHGNVAKNYEKAYSICMLGADNIAFCQATLGDLYRNAWGVDRDYQKAFQYYQKAASHHEPYPYAQHMMGEMFLNGEGVPYDVGVAKENFIMAAKHYYEPSKHKLETLERTMQYSNQIMATSPTPSSPTTPTSPSTQLSEKRTNRWSIGTIFSKKK